MPATLSKGHAVHTLEKLREQQAEHLEKAQAIVDLVESENRDYTPEEQAAWDEHISLADDLGRTYEQELVNDKRAAIQAAQQDALHKFDARPRADDVLRNGQLARVLSLKERWENDPRRGFRNFGDFAISVYGAALDTRVDDRLIRLEAAMTVGSGPDGGWLMPPEFSQTIWNGMNQGQVNLMSMVDTYTITGESLTLLANGEVSRQTGSRWGGVKAYWVEDGEQKPESNPRIRRIRLEPHVLAVFVQVDNTLMRNPSAVERLLNQAGPEEIIFTVNDAIIAGDGVGKPRGILTSGAAVTIAAESGQAPDTLNKTNIDKMWARMQIRSRTNSRWLINQDVDPQLEAMTAAGTTPSMAVWLPSDNGIASLAPAPNRFLKGRPIMELEQCRTLGETGDIILADMMAYALGVRGGIETDMSIHLYFDRNRTAFRMVFYVDGQPWPSDPLIPFQGTNTVSPFVVMAAR